MVTSLGAPNLLLVLSPTSIYVFPLLRCRFAVAAATKSGVESLAEVPALAGLRSLKNSKAHLKGQTMDAPPLPAPGAGTGTGVGRTPYADL